MLIVKVVVLPKGFLQVYGLYLNMEYTITNIHITKYPTILIRTDTCPTGQSFKGEGENKRKEGPETTTQIGQ